MTVFAGFGSLPPCQDGCDYPPAASLVMNNAELLRCLSARGIIHQEQHGFTEMVPGIQNDARIVCAEVEMKYGFSGISFWLYGENASWFLGLWSGSYFRINKPELLEEMVVELFSGIPVPKGKPPPSLPDWFVDKYGLHEMQ
ncbi:MAG TPA: hypothetical protein VMD30_12015 [Tepidisphaeraceae bacterium]|nr:hypothetical protein [Tepidisphaeraceae bacterium]